MAVWARRAEPFRLGKQSALGRLQLDQIMSQLWGWVVDYESGGAVFVKTLGWERVWHM